MKHFLGLLTVLACIVPYTTAHAETVLRSASDISITQDQVIEGDFYGSGGPFGRVTVSGEVVDDALLFAGSVLVNGTIGADLSVLGGNAQISAAAADDVRIVAADATISETVGGDVMVLAGTFKLMSTAVVKGNVYIFGGTADIDGTVEGSVYGVLERLTVSGDVGGDMDIHAPAGLVLTDSAHVSGGVTYESQISLQRAPSAVIEGEVVGKQTAAPDTRAKVREILTPIFMLLFASLTLYLFFKRGLVALVELIDASPFVASGVGVAVFFGAPIAAILLLFTVLGVLLGLIFFGAVMVFMTLSVALAGVVCGAFLYRTFFGRLEVSPVTVVGGTLVLAAATMVPVIGFLFVLAVYFVTLGGLVRSAYNILHTRAE